jgi:hypothetical protein
VASVVGERRIELVAVDPTMSRAKAIARKKFAGWCEEAHEADRLAEQLAGEENP